MTAKVIPPVEIPSGPPIEPSVDELRRAQQLAQRIRQRRDSFAARWDDMASRLERMTSENRRVLERRSGRERRGG